MIIYGHLSPIAQSASVVGIWGIIFLIYWFASTFVFALENWKENKKIAVAGSTVFLSVLVFTIIFGVVRLTLSNNDTKTVKVAAITLDNSDFYKTVYKTVTGKEINIILTSPDSGQLKTEFQC